MWDTLEVTHEGTNEVKRVMKHTLIQEYEMFRMLKGETIAEVQKRFTHIINHEKKVHYLVDIVDKLSKGKSNFENILASQSCVFGKAGLGFNPQNKQDNFSKKFLRKPVKQPIVKSKQPVVTCFYCMKKGHSVRFCKIRKFYVPRGFMKWIPKGCEVPKEKKKSIGPTFVKGPNLIA